MPGHTGQDAGRGDKQKEKRRGPRPAPTPAPEPAPAPAPAPVAPAPTPEPAPAAPTPIAQGLKGAINRSSGNTGSALFNPTALSRAKKVGTPIGELITSVDKSRQRSATGGITGGNLTDPVVDRSNL